MIQSGTKISSAGGPFNGVVWISDQHSKQVASVPGVEWKVVPQ
jgi:hypothetical protein